MVQSSTVPSNWNSQCRSSQARLYREWMGWTVATILGRESSCLIAVTLPEHARFVGIDEKPKILATPLK